MATEDGLLWWQVLIQARICFSAYIHVLIFNLVTSPGPAAATRATGTKESHSVLPALA